LLAATAVLVGASPGHSQQGCPSGSFLAFGNLVYASETIPGSVSLAVGAELGGGTVDKPTGTDPCRRDREDATVVRLGELDASVAVGVAGMEGVAFVLGSRCSGYEKSERWRCLLEPLSFGGKLYTASRYPAGKTLTHGDRLGPATLDDKDVHAVEIAGIDPEIAVAVEGRTGEAFVAPYVCPYERFAVDTVRDDLKRCLTGPTWLTFDPPGARVGEVIVATGDRPLPAELAGAPVALARLRIVADIVPRAFNGNPRIGTLTSGPDGRALLRFDAPEVAAGVYEAVVVCGRCEGRRRFPAGSVLIGPKAEGSSGPRYVVIGAGLLIFALGITAVVVYRRNRRRRGA
jgi:hypothetical protein